MTAGVFILIAGYMKTPTLAIASMCVAGAGNGLVYAGFHVNMLDVAPRNASIVMGICNAIANTAGFLSPMLVGFITRNKVGVVLMLSQTKITRFLIGCRYVYWCKHSFDVTSKATDDRI